MYVSWCLGGLGNQMFQYAFKRAYELKHRVTVKLDISGFETYDWHKFKLDRFNTDRHYSTKEENLIAKQPKTVRNTYLPGMIRKYFHIEKNKIINEKSISEINGAFTSQTQNFYDKAYFAGYFASEKYFIDYRREIIDCFTLSVPLNKPNIRMLAKIKATNSISLHVRRGNYLALKHIYNICSLEYYKQAINEIANDVSEPHLFLFSNDIEWVKENLEIDYPFTVVDINNEDNDHFDMELMKNCKHNIIANSTFSWWSAWLNENKDKIVIAPDSSIWFCDGRASCDIPEAWKQILA